MKLWIEPTSFADRLQDAWFNCFLWGMLLAGPAVLASSLLWNSRHKQRWLQALLVLWLAGSVLLIQKIGPFQVSPHQATTSWLGVAWIVGSLVSLGVLVNKIICAWRFGANSTLPEPDLQWLFFEEKRALGAMNVKLMVNSEMDGELAVCRHRTVFVSPELQATLSESQVRAVLRHEIAHAINHHWVQWMFESVLFTLLFWHPVGWWLKGALSEAREMESDDAARKIDRLGYAEALLKLQKVKRQSWIFAFGSPCKARWKRLAEPFDGPPGLSGRFFGKAVSGVSVLLAGLIGQLLLEQSQPNRMTTFVESKNPTFRTIQVTAIASAEADAVQGKAFANSAVFIRQP